MVRLTKIYTRGGDAGETSLGGGARVKKHDARVEAYGTVDEANAAIGLARLETEGEADAMLERIQNDLFDLGADLCRPGSLDEGLRIAQSQIDRLEDEIDAMNERLKPLESFILPGGGRAAAALHLARTVIRRAERLITALAEAGACQSAGGDLRQPALRPPLRARPPPQRGRRNRHALGPRRQSVGRRVSAARRGPFATPQPPGSSPAAGRRRSGCDRRAPGRSGSPAASTWLA